MCKRLFMLLMLEDDLQHLNIHYFPTFMCLIPIFNVYIYLSLFHVVEVRRRPTTSDNNLMHAVGITWNI